MGSEFVVKPVDLDDTVTKEYSLIIDGVIEVEGRTEVKSFFDGLLDAVIEYVEKHNAVAGLSMSHKEYRDLEGNEQMDGPETTENW